MYNGDFECGTYSCSKYQQVWGESGEKRLAW